MNWSSFLHDLLPCSWRGVVERQQFELDKAVDREVELAKAVAVERVRAGEAELATDGLRVAVAEREAACNTLEAVIAELQTKLEEVVGQDVPDSYPFALEEPYYYYGRFIKMANGTTFQYPMLITDFIRPLNHVRKVVKDLGYDRLDDNG